MSNLVKNYNRKKISFVRGKGSYLYTANGTKYLDFVQGIAVNCLGHAHPKLVKTITDQSKKLWHVSNAFKIPEGEKLAKKLCLKTFADYVMFQNSGAEATEAAIKVARRYFYSIGKPKKNRILCIKNSFHGRTIAAIFASGSKKMTEGFGPKVPGFDHINFKDTKPRFPNLRKKIKKNTAAIMVEPILGEGGIKQIPDKCLKYLRKICNEKEILLICDEIQAGVGRSSDFFAFEQSKIKPDIVDIVSSKKFLNNVKKLSKYFLLNLNLLRKKYPHIIKEIRGRGFLIGIKLYKDQAKFIQKLMDNNLLTIRAAENVVRVLPPLNVKKSELDQALKIINKVCTNFK